MTSWVSFHTLALQREPDCSLCRSVLKSRSAESMKSKVPRALFVLPVNVSATAFCFVPFIQQKISNTLVVLTRIFIRNPSIMRPTFKSGVHNRRIRVTKSGRGGTWREERGVFFPTTNELNFVFEIVCSVHFEFLRQSEKHPLVAKVYWTTSLIFTHTLIWASVLAAYFIPGDVLVVDVRIIVYWL